MSEPFDNRFDPPAEPPATPAPAVAARREPAGPDPRRWPRRTVALAIGCAVSSVTVLACWVGYRTAFHYCEPQATTRSLIQYHSALLDRRVERGEVLPTDLRWTEAERATVEAMFGIRLYEMDAFHDRDRWHLDTWGRPFLYEVDGDSYSVRSLGRDGRPGGRGHDADLESGRPPRPEERPTLSDFLFAQPSEGMVLTSGVAGVVSFLASLVLLRRSPSSPSVTRIATMAVCTVLLAIVVSLLHIPFLTSH